MERREITEILNEIDKEIPGFSREELISYTKWVIQKLYNSLKEGENVQIKCTPELQEKLKDNKEKYRINKDIENINFQYIDLYDTEKKEGQFVIKLYVSICFFDDADNTLLTTSFNDKYWNDIWIVSYVENSETVQKRSKCSNCGANMSYNKYKNVFLCEYCGNMIENIVNSKWEICDIEVLQS